MPRETTARRARAKRDGVEDAVEHVFAGEEEFERGRPTGRRSARKRDGLAKYHGRDERELSREREFEAEDEAIEITRAELERLREKIDQARSDAGMSSRSRSSSRHGSRHSSRHSSRRSVSSSRHSSRHSSSRSTQDYPSTTSIDPDFANERSTTVGGSTVNEEAGVMTLGQDLLEALQGGKKIWDDDEVDDESMIESMNAHQIGSAIVPQKVVEKYEKAKRDYDAALKAKRDKKDQLRREARAADKNKPSATVDNLAQQFSRAFTVPQNDPNQIRKRMDYKNTHQLRAKAARLAHVSKHVPTPWERLSGVLFGCCTGRGR